MIFWSHYQVIFLHRENFILKITTYKNSGIIKIFTMFFTCKNSKNNKNFRSAVTAVCNKFLYKFFSVYKLIYTDLQTN